ncbi:MAG: hypothetical protein HDR01_08225 [Lachnospiraceae bacterium]|nr:hypothetical protein [Lachnospiraceae bacterium]
MNHILSVADATEKLYNSLSESTGWKFLKSQRCLKKTVKDLIFEIDFFSSKWNCSQQSVEVNAEFWLRCKSYGKLPVDNVIASMPYRPELYDSKGGSWYDISTEKKLNAAFKDLNMRIHETAVSLCIQFETDYLAAVKGLLEEHFDEYNVHLDFIADKLGKSAIEDKAREIYAGLSKEMKQQVMAYKNGAKNESWMVNRGNLKYIVDNELVNISV